MFLLSLARESKNARAVGGAYGKIAAMRQLINAETQQGFLTPVADIEM